eukprot:15285507-Heterocapsa_arctica.AAC.1
MDALQDRPDGLSACDRSADERLCGRPAGHLQETDPGRGAPHDRRRAQGDLGRGRGGRRRMDPVPRQRVVRSGRRLLGAGASDLLERPAGR